MTSILKTESLSCRFEASINEIRYPNLNIREGSVTFIRGESGSGKSTLLKLFNGIAVPTSGTILYCGRNILDYNPLALRREVLLVAQSAYLFDTTIENNFGEFGGYLDLELQDREEIRKYLHICCVMLPLEADCSVASGGERQRIFMAVNLALASKMSTKILMLDEPTSALDVGTADTLIENIKSYCKLNGMTLIVVSHDGAIADKYADVVLGLHSL